MRNYLIFTVIVLIFSLKTEAYQLCFEGCDSEEIQIALESVSQLHSEIHRPPPTFFSLKKRAESDKQTCLQVMHAFGFYEADISMLYLGEFPDITVRVHINAGPQYLLGSYAITDENGLPLKLEDDECEFKLGAPARSDTILNFQEHILAILNNTGFPLAEIVDRQVLVDQEIKKVFVWYIIAKGPVAYFGPIIFDGLKKVNREYVFRKIMWKEGGLFNPQLVADTDAYLQASGLFSYVAIRPAGAVDENGILPMLIELEEKKLRHIGAGVSYSTDESVGGMFQWSHDNLRGWGDAFSFVGEYSKVVKRATFLYGIPDFYGRNQDLLYSAELRREDAPGFIEREASILVRIEKKLNQRFTFNYGCRFEKLLSTKSDYDDNYNLFSVPIQLRWDTSNKLLNPLCGTTLAYFATPYQALFNAHIFMLKQELFVATYQPLTPAGRVLLALSAQLGTIAGPSTPFIPAPKRFYAGSSTSLRGYRYLTVSPLDEKKPLGGRSLMIFMVEPRIHIYDQLYFACFYDMGNVFDTSYPLLNQKMLRSCGCGIRYLTPVGPFRLDIGFPIDRRKGIDRSFQIYTSIGQTF